MVHYSEEDLDRNHVHITCRKKSCKSAEIQAWRLQGEGLGAQKREGRNLNQLPQGSALGSGYGSDTSNSYFALSVYLCICVETKMER